MASRRRSNTRRKASVRPTLPQYPGHYLTVGSKDRESVRAVQVRLNQVGCDLVPENGNFDSETKAAVRLFQTHPIDSQEQSMKVD